MILKMLKKKSRGVKIWNHEDGNMLPWTICRNYLVTYEKSGMCEDWSWGEGGELQIYMIVMLRGNVMDITTCHILGDRHIPLHKV